MEDNRIKNKSFALILDNQMAEGLRNSKDKDMKHVSGPPGFNKLSGIYVPQNNLPEDKTSLLKELTDISTQIVELSEKVGNIKKLLNEAQE